MSSPDLVAVSFACNDVTTGSFLGHFEAIEFDAWLSGHHVSAMGKRTRVSIGGNRRLSVGRRLFEGDCHTRWVGNWCWDAVEMRLAEAQRLLGYLLGRGWQVDEATIGNPFQETESQTPSTDAGKGAE